MSGGGRCRSLLESEAGHVPPAQLQDAHQHRGGVVDNQLEVVVLGRGRGDQHSGSRDVDKADAGQIEVCLVVHAASTASIRMLDGGLYDRVEEITAGDVDLAVHGDDPACIACPEQWRTVRLARIAHDGPPVSGRHRGLERRGTEAGYSYILRPPYGCWR